MEILLILCGYIAGILTLLFGEGVYSSIKHNKVKNTETNKQYNKVHFYVTADNYEHPSMYKLWFGKPYRNTYCEHWSPGNNTYRVLARNKEEFAQYGLNISKYSNLTFKDEPIEVYLNLE